VNSPSTPYSSTLTDPVISVAELSAPRKFNVIGPLAEELNLCVQVTFLPSIFPVTFPEPASALQVPERSLPLCVKAQLQSVSRSEILV